MLKPEEYLKKNVRGILQPMVSAVLMDKPKDPVNHFFIIYAYLINRFYL